MANISTEKCSHICPDDLKQSIRVGTWVCPWCEINRLRADLAIQAVNAKTVTDLQAEVARLTQERDDYKDDSLRLHKAYCDLKYPDTSPPDVPARICVCGEPNTVGVQHRTDGPCFHIPRSDEHAE